MFKKIMMYSVALLIATHALTSNALSVTVRNGGSEKIYYFSFHTLIDNQDKPIFFGDLEPKTEKQVPGYILKQLRNTKTYVGGMSQNSIFSCGEVDFNENNDLEIVVSGHECSVK